MKLLHVLKPSGNHTELMRVTGNKVTFWPSDSGAQATVRIVHGQDSVLD